MNSMKQGLFGIVLLWISAVSSAQSLEQAAIASAHPLATQAGLDILEQGGNAFDAAVTVASVLAVVEPYGSGLGGGGFFLLGGPAIKDKYEFVDAREVAPSKAEKGMFQSSNGRVKSKESLVGAKAAAIPGEVAGLDYVSQQYGTLPLSQTLARAIELAEQGFEVNKDYIRMMNFRFKDFQQEGDSLFLQDGQVPEHGYRIVQKDLAKTLRVIAEEGRDGFYRGEIADQLVGAVQKAGGIWTEKDLRDYQVKIRRPLISQYRDMTIITAPPPSAGGLSILQSLKMIDRFEEDPLSVSDTIHVHAESLRRAYCDRAKYAGDPDFVNVPTAHLISDEHIKSLKKTISLNEATPSSSLKCGVPQTEGQSTTHFSIMDANGNRVSATLTLNLPFGSAFVAEGTGVLLNDEMDDFTVKVGEPNVYGLVGHYSNIIAPNKRPVSSMSPTFFESKKGIGLIGTPGGSRIPSMVLLSLLRAEQGGSPVEWVDSPRYHQQYIPDVLSFEPDAMSDSTKSALKARGHKLEPTSRPYGNMQLVYWDNVNKTMQAVSDSRKLGLAKVIGVDEKRTASDEQE